MAQIDSATMAQYAHAAGVEIPPEQTPAWDQYTEAMPDRLVGRRLAWFVDDQPAALFGYSVHKVRGFTFLWARHAPIWLVEPTAERELAFRRAAVRALRELERSAAFVRLHAKHPAPDLLELLQSVTYDRTVILNLPGDDDALMESLKSRGRRDVRKALRNEDLVFGEETGLSDDDFDEHYQVLIETGTRDEFGIAPKSQYLTMLNAMGAPAARLFTVRNQAGELFSWVIVITTGTTALYFYAASTYTGRRAGAPDVGVWHVARTLQAEGVRTLDLLGIESERAPQLAGVGTFKTKFSDDVVEVAGAWDVALRPRVRQFMESALRAKRSVGIGVARAKARISRSKQPENSQRD